MANDGDRYAQLYQIIVAAVGREVLDEFVRVVVRVQWRKYYRCLRCLKRSDRGLDTDKSR